MAEILKFANMILLLACGVLLIDIWTELRKKGGDRLSDPEIELPFAAERDRSGRQL